MGLFEWGIVVVLQNYNNMDKFEELKVRIFDRFIDKFAERYIQQRSAVPASVLEQAAALDCGLDTEALMRVIRSTSC